MNCPTFPELDLGEWSEKLLEQLQGRRYPLEGVFELTERCNLACLHCYINQPAASRAAKAHELTTAQAVAILDQMAEAGCLFVLLTGGEPLLRPDFPEIYEHARQRGILLSLFTNGTLLTPRIADLLADQRPHSVEISIYGATAETYERVTGVPGSYARCRRGIDLLQERGLPLSLKTVLLSMNYQELEGMHILAEQLGLEFRYDDMLWPRLDGSQGAFKYQLPLREMIGLDKRDPERRQGWEKMAELSRDSLFRNEFVYSCGAGLRSFHVDCAGKMSICDMSRRHVYDLLQMSFQQAWEQMGSLREMRRQLDTPCQTCKAGGLCTQCPGWSQAIHGDDETPVELVCTLGRRRAEQFQYTS